MPRHASRDGSAARTIWSGISGGSIGRSIACSRSERPGIRAGVPVKNTFWHRWRGLVSIGKARGGKGWRERGRGGELAWRTWTRRPRSSIEKDARTFWRTSPSPALSTPAILGANQVSQTRQRSMLKWIRARPTMKGRKSRILCIGKRG
jgi:hypothetical protein